MTFAAYPVHVDATLDRRMSRWLWLVKWLLAIPHYIVLIFLWIAFVAVSVVAFFAILFTGRYPRGMFDFNVGVLRWSWRVAYYTYGALGTDRYPPFTLADDPGYPAHFDVDYPTELSRGLVLVKWWLLAIPHYVVVGIFLGGGTWAVWHDAQNTRGVPGLVGILVFIAAIMLAFTGRYPQQIFDFVLGMNRWALRVAAYAGLMTDRYPPFRLDMGGHEPAGTVTVPPPSYPPAGPQVADPNLTSSPPPAAPGGFAGPTPGAVPLSKPPAGPPGYPYGPPQGPTGPRPAHRGWTAGRIVALVIGSVLGLMSLGALAAGGVGAWATGTQRDAAGYLTSGVRHVDTASYAITSDSIDLGTATDVVTQADVLGTVRIRVTPTSTRGAIFVGIASQSQVSSYLSGVSHLVVTNWASTHTRLETGTGSTRPTLPTRSPIWVASAVGRGTQILKWRPTGGQWAVVVMNANSAPGVSVNADVGASVPDLAWIAAGLLGFGVVLLASSIVLITVPVVRASR